MDGAPGNVGRSAIGSAHAAGPSQSEPDRGLVSVVNVPLKETRPEYGSAGRATQLCVNYLKDSLSKAGDVYHYNRPLLHMPMLLLGGTEDSWWTVEIKEVLQDLFKNILR